MGKNTKEQKGVNEMNQDTVDVWWPHIIHVALYSLAIIGALAVITIKWRRKSAKRSVSLIIDAIPDSDFQNAATAFRGLYGLMHEIGNLPNENARRVFRNFIQRGSCLTGSENLKSFCRDAFSRVNDISEREMVECICKLLNHFEKVGVIRYAAESNLVNVQTFYYYDFANDGYPEYGTPYKVVRNAWVQGEKLLEKGVAEV